MGESKQFPKKKRKGKVTQSEKEVWNIAKERTRKKEREKSTSKDENKLWIKKG